MSHLITQGFEIAPQIISSADLEILRTEADRIAAEADSSCVRHIRSKSPLFDTLASSPELLSLIPKGLKPVRSILFNKTPEQNWPVAWHQDLTIALAEEKAATGYGPWSFKDGSPHVQPPTELLEKMATIRIHLDDTPSSNGALKVIPKSHLLGKLSSDQVPKHSTAPAQVCQCAAGDALLMSPLILHASERSESPTNRRVLHFEYAPIHALHRELAWFEGSY